MHLISAYSIVPKEPPLRDVETALNKYLSRHLKIPYSARGPR